MQVNTCGESNEPFPQNEISSGAVILFVLRKYSKHSFDIFPRADFLSLLSNRSAVIPREMYLPISFFFLLIHSAVVWNILVRLFLDVNYSELRTSSI